MPQPLIQLPCSSHHGCMYHKHWDRSLSEVKAHPTQGNVDTSVTAGIEGDHCEKPLAPDEGTRRNPNSVSLQHLPAELLLNIIAHLSTLEQASLALTCRSLAHALGSEAWRRTSKAGRASWYQHAEMLDVLQRDLESDHYWRCRDCQRFHPRSQAVPRDDSGGLLWPNSTLARVLSFRKRDENSVRIGVPEDPIYVLEYALLKAIMDRHFLGAHRGVCLNTLKCQGKRTFPLSETANMSLEYEFVPKIVLDRLLLQSTYKFTPHQTMFIRNVKVDEVSTQEFLKRCGFWICGHDQAGGVAQFLKEMVEDRYPQSRYLCRNSKCAYCPTQCSVSILPHMGLRIRVWQNLGSGRSLKDPKWLHMSRTGKHSKPYPWGKENIGEAFERILCSTKKEFQRQLERSDGGGTWYDPESKKRVYKTLPPKLAERL